MYALHNKNIPVCLERILKGLNTTAVAQLVECSLRMWEVGVRIPAGSDQDFKNGSDCSFAKHSAIRNESHGSFGRDFKPRSRVTAGVAR